ncbi:hypothetical protein [Nocardia noduli]|uniref:hypothetical protein n=1 Tax=Nocardia noduli TaxID=2815722 RepID=UPI001C22E335|nr:hypothetical protein [Nocardia noduli]
MTTPGDARQADGDSPRGPHVEPQIDPPTKPSDRSATATWDIGKPDSAGYQPQAVLSVMHDSGRYSITLGAGRVQRDGVLVRVVFDAKTIPSTVLSRVDDKPRFHRGTLNKLLTQALAELRTRYDADDEVITPYFDPTSHWHIR